MLHKDELEGYYLNVSSQQPHVFVLWRMDGEQALPVEVTVSYDEAGRWLDGGHSVDGVAMPSEIFAWVGEYVENNYRPEPKKRIKPRSFLHPKDRDVVTQDNEDFLRRWSRRKKEAAAQAAAEAAVDKPAETPKPTLPPIDKLTPESDYSGFMHPKVEDALRRTALKKLFAGDPHFNLPDPYEAYSGDWTVGEPISEELLATLNQANAAGLRRQEGRRRRKQIAAQERRAGKTRGRTANRQAR